MTRLVPLLFFTSAAICLYMLLQYEVDRELTGVAAALSLTAGLVTLVRQRRDI